MATPSAASAGAPPQATSSWSAALRLAFDALVARSSERHTRERRATPELYERTAVVELGTALLDRFEIRQAPGVRGQAASGLARALVDEIELDDPAAAGQALAELFERALGERGRRDQGAVYTPVEVVDFMVDEAIAARLADALELDVRTAQRVAGGEVGDLDDELARAIAGWLRRLRLLDPAAGAGAFLLGAARRIAQIAQGLDALGTPGLGELLTPSLALSRCCHGYELDPHAARIATTVLALATCRRPGEHAPSVITQRDPLLAGMGGAGARRSWDVVVMNPPYMGEKHVRNRLGEHVTEALRQADGFTGDLLTHFVLRALESVCDGGVVSAIVSDTAFTIEATAELRRKLLDEWLLLSVTWCRPFAAVAVRGGVLTVVRRAPRAGLQVACRDASAKTRLDSASARRIPRRLFRQLPGRPIYRPSAAAKALVDRWSQVESLDERWREVAGRRSPRAVADDSWSAGAWTLLGCAVRAGQGLATGDDRRFVGLIADTPEGARALARQREMLESLRVDPQRRRDWAKLRARLGDGQTLGAALVELSGDGEIGGLPGRKPLITVDRSEVRTSPLAPGEIEAGIAKAPFWVPYETSDRSAGGGGGRWLRGDNPVVLDWSARAVALLRERRRNGPLRPVLRNEDLWFQGGVTHNRISSHLRARLMPKHAIFSSESPLYVTQTSWLTPLALLALLNAPVVEFALKTFLASRNHIEVGHIRRLPIPVLDAAQTHRLERLCSGAVEATRQGETELTEIEAEIDRFTRELYGVEGLSLQIVR